MRTPGETLVRVQRASAIYDYAAAGIFALPVIAGMHLAGPLRAVHELCGATGRFPTFEPFHLLFASLFGGFAVMWSTLRIVKPIPILGLCDGLLRLYYAALLSLHVLYWDASIILAIFIAAELAWGSTQVLLYRAQRSSPPVHLSAADSAQWYAQPPGQPSSFQTPSDAPTRP